MRLHEIEATLRRALPRLVFEAHAVGSQVEISGFKDAIDAVSEIRATGMLEKETMAVLEIEELVSFSRDSIREAPDVKARFEQSLKRVQVRGGNILEALESALKPEEPDEIAVKLPEQSSLKSVADMLVEIETLLNQAVVNEHVNGEVRLRTFDVGSEWVVIGLVSMAAVRVVGRICRVIQETRLQNVQIESQKETVRGLRIGHDFIEKGVRSLDAQLAEWKEAQIEEIARAAGAPDSEFEYRVRLKNVVTGFTELIDKGLEIQASHTLSPAELATFPPGGVLRKLIDVGRDLQQLTGRVEKKPKR